MKSVEESIDLLTRVSNAFGPSGMENQVADIFKAELQQTMLTTDKMGNVYSSTGAQGPTVMLAAHMDEVGFMVQSITAGGFLKIVALGGWWGHTLLSQRVKVLNRAGEIIPGVVSCKPPHLLAEAERSKVQKVDGMFIDIGAESAEEVADVYNIKIGDTVVPATETEAFGKGLLIGKAFDDRGGLSAMVETVQQLDEVELPYTLTAVATVQEEVGTRGAQAAVNKVKPDMAIILEGTPADDFPGNAKDNIQGALKKGPQIRIMDPTALMSRGLWQFLEQTAADLDIPVQMAVRRTGGTDAKVVHLHGEGVPTVVIGIPARYIHSHNSIIAVEDYLNTVKLLVAALSKLTVEQIAEF